MARVGFGHCRHEEAGQFRGLERYRECARYQRAEEKIIAGREAWAAEREAKGEE